MLRTILHKQGARLAVGHAQRGFQRGQVLYGVLVELALPQQVPLPMGHMPSVGSQTSPTTQRQPRPLTRSPLSQQVSYHPATIAMRNQHQFRWYGSPQGTNVAAALQYSSRYAASK